MKAFRFVALGYALLVLLIAPAWLAADEDPAAPPAQDVVDAVPVPAPAVEPASAAEPEEPAAVAQEAQQPEAEDEEPEPKPQPKEGEKQAKGEPIARAAASGSVTITDFEFTPATITVNVGDTVTWVNEGPTPHTATANDGSFDTGMLNEGQSGSHTFDSAGTFAYICTPHPNMKGTVVVKGESASSDSGSDDSDAGDSGSAGADADDSDSDSGSGLPATGSETLLIALFGAITLGLGVLLRRRADA